MSLETQVIENRSFFVPRRIKYRIRTQFLVAILAAALIPLLVSDITLMSESQDLIETNILELNTRVAGAIADDVAQYFLKIEELLTVLNRTVNHPEIDINLRSQVLTSFLEEHPEVTNFILENDQFMTLTTFSQLEDDPIFQEQILEAITRLSQGDTYRSDPYLRDDGRLYLLYAMSIKRAGERVSRIFAEIDLQPVRQLISGVIYRKSGRAFLVDQHGRLIPPMKQEKSIPPLTDMSRVEVVRQYFSAKLPVSGALTYQDYFGEKVVGSFALILPLEWGVIVQEPREEVYRPIQNIKKIILLHGLIFSISALILGIIVARKLTHPIAKLTQFTMGIAQGGFGKQMDLIAHNEIGRLSETFNYMSAQLQKHQLDMWDLFRSSIKAIMEAMEAKDPYTRGHSERVGKYSVAIAKELGIDSQEIEQLEIAAELHDIGKIGIEDRILSSTKTLSEEEFNVIKTHPERGARIIEPIKMLAFSLPGIRWHHERVDGTGYPDELVGDQIPLQARILAVADTFDAMTSTRSYQIKMNPDRVFNKIKEWSGTRYDPKVVDAFVRAYEKGFIQLIEADESFFVTVGADEIPLVGSAPRTGARDPITDNRLPSQ
ncbi:MAG: hypothetical protein B6244_13525 [Candidatus Cloacimonetes bacterium 4572_55]|nr:MAG: hypothetical protein B6244_13525 [Candidatus Cloacimonetes bacterium 4572_55]